MWAAGARPCFSGYLFKISLQVLAQCFCVCSFLLKPVVPAFSLPNPAVQGAAVSNLVDSEEEVKIIEALDYRICQSKK